MKAITRVLALSMALLPLPSLADNQRYLINISDKARVGCIDLDETRGLDLVIKVEDPGLPVLFCTSRTIILGENGDPGYHTEHLRNYNFFNVRELSPSNPLYFTFKDYSSDVKKYGHATILPSTIRVKDRYPFEPFKVINPRKNRLDIIGSKQIREADEAWINHIEKILSEPSIPKTESLKFPEVAQSEAQSENEPPSSDEADEPTPPEKAQDEEGGASIKDEGETEDATETGTSDEASTPALSDEEKQVLDEKYGKDRCKILFFDFCDE